ncbi:Asp/Glu/hydantoin racemase [Reichenbachiella carrageenanivorans]|uniref:Asp/Glu/hydantoin racemase n=1 Tax=Reichenbachiella carrageenanivorans TaxID=2979869 RepID=A0ABY6D142_9BACT|nr:Asp/Glu/hydantoin racemase [Reichenbachiella carrageenanivorans]UXX79866.1 Asp/Glu/hydantoin racemase [Reichenbachiella carrageenanivorans]
MRIFKPHFLLFLVGLVFACQSPNSPVDTDIRRTIIGDEKSFYHIDFENYPANRKSLPIGVFDSGTGGLTVLKAIVNFDEYGGESHALGADGVQDFAGESFIYLGDQANMPYGNYSNAGKVDLLKEHIIKDAQFLLGNKYYTGPEDSVYQSDKDPVKAIVVACNTATAYGKSDLDDFLQMAHSDVKVIGVIDAGVRGALELFGQDENGIVGVLATAGTVASKGYKSALDKYIKELGYTGHIEVFDQGGVGIAEAVDEDANYFVRGLKTPRESYKGPDLSGDLKIDKTLLDIYNFDYDAGKMLCDAASADDCSIMQINDAENYVRYHLVTLLEKIRKSESSNQLKTIILGCTHYPYLTEEISKVLTELYNYQNQEGQLIYRSYMVEHITLVDPAVNTARELFAHLQESALFSETNRIENSEFYISVPNQTNQHIQTDKQGNFTYDYKYGRQAGQNQEFVKVVPFSKKNISSDILERFKQQIPNVYELMVKFNETNPKAEYLSPFDKIQ